MSIFENVAARDAALTGLRHIDCFGEYSGVVVYSVSMDRYHITGFDLVNESCESAYIYRALCLFFKYPGFFTLKEYNSALSPYNFSRSSTPLFLGFNSQHLQFFRLFGCQGKRFFSRGLIRNQSANQSLVVCGSKWAERGSCLVAFKQAVNLCPQPRIYISKDDHPGYIIRQQCQYYKRFILSLLDFAGKEKQLTQALTREVLGAIDGYQMYALVFVKPDKVQLDEERQILRANEFSYFQLRLISSPDKAQKALYVISENVCYLALDYHSVVRFFKSNDFMKDIFRLIPSGFLLRVNCLDSLDRTNAVLAQYFGYLGQQNSGFVEAGNYYSRQYASTQAMKYDLVVLGTRTLAGRLKDFGIWLQRWYFNNFSDAAIHDGYLLVYYGDALRYGTRCHVNFFLFLTAYLVCAVGLESALLLCVRGSIRFLWFSIALAALIAVFCVICRFGSSALVLLPRFAL